jgi:ribosomal protein S18 acetylase RimI-like enzyme
MIEYRECASADIAAVLEFWDSSAGRGSTNDERSVTYRLERDRDLFLLAFDGGRLVGSVMGGWDGWRGNIYRLAVASTHRRLGIATILVARVEERLRALGCRRAYANADRRSEMAGEFWRSLGYSLNDRVEPLAKNLAGDA